MTGSGRTAVITGASQGVGKAIAAALCADGADVILAGRSLDSLNKAAGEFEDPRNRVTCLELDLSVQDKVETFAAQVQDIAPQIDILINCAGSYHSAAWSEASLDRLDELYRTNVRGTFAVTQALLPMLTRSAGDVVFVNSSIVNFDGDNAGQYAATKHALVGLADSLRAESNDKGVRVLTAYLGRTASPMQEAIHRESGREYRPEKLLQPQDVARIVVACLNLDRTAEVTELRIRPNLKTY